MFKTVVITTLLYWVISTPSVAETFYGTVTHVCDGDTINVLTHTLCKGTHHCRDGKKERRIRFADIDTPELNQPWGKHAKQALSSLVKGKVVRVVRTDTDRYGRIVGHVYVGDTWVNGRLVKTGNAWVYRWYAKSAKLFSYEHAAKRHAIGLWALPPAQRIPPWEWRHKK